MGAVGNLNYLQMLDFMLGFFTIDVCGDDGTKHGAWPWQRGTILTDPEATRKVVEPENGPGGPSPFEGEFFKSDVEAWLWPQQDETKSLSDPTVKVETPEPVITGLPQADPPVKTLSRYDTAQARRLSQLRP